MKEDEAKTKEDRAELEAISRSRKRNHHFLIVALHDEFWTVSRFSIPSLMV